jgi:hypothetical protein
MSSERGRDDVWNDHVAMAAERGLTIPERMDPEDYDLFRELLGDAVFDAMLASEMKKQIGDWRARYTCANTVASRETARAKLVAIGGKIPTADEVCQGGGLPNDRLY